MESSTVATKIPRSLQKPNPRSGKELDNYIQARRDTREFFYPGLLVRICRLAGCVMRSPGGFPYAKTAKVALAVFFKVTENEVV